MKTELLKKHHFWILFAVVPLFVGLLFVLLMTGPGEAIAEQGDKYDKQSKEVAGAKAQGTGMLVELGKQKETLEERRGQLWGDNYTRQKEAGVFAWPDAGKDKYLKDLEKLDLRFGALGVSTLDATKDADTQFLDVNDEIKKFTETTNYLESYNRLAASLLPTKFAGAGWPGVLRHVTDWGTGRPEWSLFWLSLEDFWIQRALLKPIAQVNANAAKFDLVKPPAGTPDTPLKRKFQNRTWEIDIELATEGSNRVLKSKLKNKTDRLQMLGSNKTMRLNVWFDDPKIGNSQPFEYKIGGELVKGFGELTPKLVAEIHKIPAGVDPAEIYKVEQVLDEITVPIRLVRRVELGFRDSKRSAAELKAPSFFPEDAPATEALPAGGGPGPGGGPPAGLAGLGAGGREGPGGGGATAGEAGSATRTGTAEVVLLGNKKRYIERTEQVRRMPIGLDLVVDQAYVNDILIELANSPLRLQITQTQWQRFRDSLVVGGAAAPPSGTEGGPRGEGEGRPPMVGPAGFGPGSGSGAPPGDALPTSQVTAGLVELAIYGIVNVYEKTKPKPIDPAKPVDEKPGEPMPVDPMPMKPDAPTAPPK